MLSRDGCYKRRQRLWQALGTACDWAVIADPQHLMYFANYYQSPFVFRSNDAGAILLLQAHGTSYLVADNLLEPFTARAYVDEVVAPIWYRGKEAAPHREAWLVRNALQILKAHEKSRIAVEFAQVPVGLVLGLRELVGHPDRLLDLDPVIRPLKRRKDPDELELLQRSMRAGAAAMRQAMQEVRPGMSELEVFYLVQRAAQAALGEQALVYGDFVSGPRCEQIGGPPTARTLRTGDLVLLDFSTVVYHYRADFANTFVCGAKPTTRQRDLFEACREALAAGERVLRAGAVARDVDRAVRGTLEAKHLGQHFPHHSGHGIGLGHPEPPYLVPGSDEVLLAGDVVTLEPGLYIPGVAGMRYERNYLVTDDGYRLLSHHPIQIEAGA